ncbi:MAG: hypothetical protein IJT39_04545 [Bacteroidales bacterium]|nr:hypothetical protein [Bacteroidales bacterium]
MKAKRMIIAAVVLLALVPSASAQKQIKEAFADVEKYSGVTKTGEQTTSTVDANGINVESSVVTIRVKGRDYYRAVFDKVKEAFDKEGKNASWAVVETGPEKMGVDSATIHDLGLDRKLWSVWRENAEPVLVGNMKNSSYRLMNFDDKKHPDYRTCTAAEWSNADTPDVYRAQLVYVYGRKPESASGEKPRRSVSIMRSIRRSPSDLIEQSRQWSLPDSISSIDNLMQQQWNIPDVDSLMKNINPVMRQSYRLYPNIAPQDIPFDGDKDKWMALAMQRGVCDLSNGDWHRFFGLLTQKMMDRANKESKDDMVVAASLILDLCKNADQLDDDEREVSARRLEDVADHHFDNDQYIYDLLMLGVKKLQKK